MHDIVVIEDSTIMSMVKNEAFTSAFPCLQGQASILEPANTGCGMCARRRQEAQRRALAGIKTCLGGLDSAGQQKLKELLNTQQIKVIFTSATGQVSSVTF